MNGQTFDSPEEEERYFQARWRERLEHPWGQRYWSVRRAARELGIRPSELGERIKDGWFRLTDKGIDREEVRWHYTGIGLGGAFWDERIAGTDWADRPSVPKEREFAQTTARWRRERIRQLRRHAELPLDEALKTNSPLSPRQLSDLQAESLTGDLATRDRVRELYTEELFTTLMAYGRWLHDPGAVPLPIRRERFSVRPKLDLTTDW